MHPLIATFTARAALTFDGIFSTSSASSPVTSATRTITGTGTLLFSDIGGDILTPEYSKNGGAWTTITDGGTLAMSNGDTLAVRCALIVVGWVSTFEIKNNSGGALIEAVTLTRT
jgi:hypothetical protein